MNGGRDQPRYANEYRAPGFQGAPQGRSEYRAPAFQGQSGRGGYDRGSGGGGYDRGGGGGGYDRGGRGGYDRGGNGGFDRGPRPAPAGHGGERSFGDGRPPREEKTLYPITCMSCGADSQVPFKPIEGRDIFCRDCYRAQRG